ncbi:MAG: phospholipase A [Prevotella sp.]|jgi:phospholipase A1|nr:phospholipase A [Prevotella sp.]
MKNINFFLPLIICTVITFNLKAQVGYLQIADSTRQKLEKHTDTSSLNIKNQIHITEQEAIKVLDALPAFAVYRDIFFTTGIPLNEKITRKSADALFQISFRQRLTKSYLLFNTFAYLTYTQKSFWDIYDDSAPFRDSNYNPGIGLGKYIIRNNKLEGAMFMQIEHESNGRDGEESRSWNYLSFSAKYFYNHRLSLGIKAWIPYVDGDANKNLIDYRGIATLSVNYQSNDSKWWLATEVTPRKGWGNANTTVTAAFRISKNSNQYLYARFFNGKGDSLLDYDKYNMNIRFGICIKPDFYSVY